MAKDKLDLLQGTLDLLILRALRSGSTHGFGISEWGISENNRKAKFYRLTATGRKQLAIETDGWIRMSSAINLVLNKA